MITHDPYIKIYDSNIKVTQRLAGHLALDVTSLEKAKRLFKIKTEGLARFCSGAGLMHSKTSAREQEKLRREMFHCQPPLILTDML